MQETVLAGERVYLRPLERNDAELIVVWLRNRELTWSLGDFFPAADVRAVADGIERLYRSGHDLLLGVVRRDTDTLIGITELHHLDLDNRQASFGLLIGQTGEGYGPEVAGLVLDYAFGPLALNRVWVQVDERNTRGIRAYQKVGFRREGLLRESRYVDGRYHNTLLMAVLRGEWRARGK